MGAAGKDDPEVLRIAANEGRILVSHDLRTMPGHFGEFIAGTASPGLILIPQKLKSAVAIEQLLMIGLGIGSGRVGKPGMFLTAVKGRSHLLFSTPRPPRWLRSGNEETWS